jgi:hypothetical protein
LAAAVKGHERVSSAVTPPRPEAPPPPPPLAAGRKRNVLREVPEEEAIVLIAAADKLAQYSRLFLTSEEREYRQGIRDAAAQLRNWANGF